VYTAEIEPIGGVVRVWAGGSSYGDPYEWAASVRWLSREEIEILGYTKPITRDVWRAIIKTCNESGIKKILAVRYRAGQRREKWIDVSKWSRR
jgi:hypothetical protein